MSNLSNSTISSVLPKIINKGRNMKVAQSKFLQRMSAAKVRNNVNPGGTYSPFTIEENDTAFGVAENGPILQGSSPEYTIGSINIRAHWSSMAWSGKIERIRDQYLTKFTRDADMQKKYSLPQLQEMAANSAVKDQVISTLKMYARRENYFALQGLPSSAIGVVTAEPGTPNIDHSWDTTPQGNRMFNKNQQIQYYSSAGLIHDNGLTSKNYITVASKPDKTWQNGDNGRVAFDEIPTDLDVTDVAVFRNSYGLMPEGVLTYLNDTGTFKGITRTDDPETFESVMIRETGSPTFGPSHIREGLSQLESKRGYGTSMDIEFWMNKTQRYNWESQVYNSPFVRNIGPGMVQKLDMAVGDVYWDGHPFNIDVDVPPDTVLGLFMADWEKLEQTRLQAYEFDSGQYVKTPINSDGDFLDSRMSTIFSEYNWDCLNPQQLVISGLGFDRRHV